MKKKVLFILLGVVLLIATSLVVIFSNKDNKNIEPFYLEDKYYESKEMTEIKNEELNDLIDKKESFIVFVYQTQCAASSKFEDVLLEFLEENQVRMYKVLFSNIKETKLGKKLKYYPSFLIYHKGELVDYLRSDKDEDVEYFKTKEGFKKWLTKYVILKDSSNNN